MKTILLSAFVLFSNLGLANSQLCQIRTAEQETSLSAYELGTLLKAGATTRVFASNTKYSAYELEQFSKQSKQAGKEFTICVDQLEKFSTYYLGQFVKAGADVVLLP